jgi:hypothetical protein
LFAVIGVIALFFVITQVSETRGRSLETLEEDVETSGYSTSGGRAACTSGAAEGPARVGAVSWVPLPAPCSRWGGTSQVKGAYGVAAAQGATLDMRAPQRAALLQTPGDSDSSGCRRSAGHMKPRGQDLVIKKSTDGNSSGARFLGSPAAPTHSA